MFNLFFCVAGIFLILLVAELLWERKIIRGEYLRKFVHITAGSFIAIWPWLISWHAIQLLSLAMLVVILINHYWPVLNYHGWIGRATYGEIFMALAVLVCALFANDRIFFEIAILQVALADGFAAIAGIRYGKHWKYEIFGHRKTLIGTMVFWFVSAAILMAALLPANNIFSFEQYYMLVIMLPPLLTLAENVAVFGLDNLVIPVITIAVLNSLS
jgi:dolichol kinase